MTDVNTWIIGDYRDNPPPPDTTLIIADPVYTDNNMVNGVIEQAVSRNIPICVFMFPSNLCELKRKPEQICHWIKQPSTKNTVKKYSNFVEVIAMYGVSFYEQLHWTNRCGIFTDSLFTNKEHEWKKPESLLERLIRSHYPGHGTIYDPCAGTGTTHTVCSKLGIPSVCMEINPSMVEIIRPSVKPVDMRTEKTTVLNATQNHESKEEE